jgi:hypothetical protein
MYYARNTHTEASTELFYSAWEALDEGINELEWDECETKLMVRENGLSKLAEFPCTYSFHYGDEAHNCELPANRPDSLCPFHAGDEA